MDSAPDIGVLLERLHTAYPNARYELNWETPLQLLVATILAAQCTDERVNQVTPALFARYPDAAAFANAVTEELETLIRSTGTYKVKAKSIQGACRKLVSDFGGEVPRTIEELITLPGIQRKSANVVLATAWNIASGVIVDVHVNRLSERLGLAQMALVPQSEWTFFGPAIILHGRYTCTARAPKCAGCCLEDICPQIGVGAALPEGDAE